MREVPRTAAEIDGTPERWSRRRWLLVLLLIAGVCLPLAIVDPLTFTAALPRELADRSYWGNYAVWVLALSVPLAVFRYRRRFRLLERLSKHL